MTIVQEDCYGLIEPGSGEDQVNSMISIDIARLNPQSACRRDKPNRLPPDCGELKLNPVVSRAGAVWPSLNASQIRTHISVKICYCKLRARSDRSDGSTARDICRRRFATTKAKKQQERGPQEKIAEPSPIAFWARSAVEFLPAVSHVTRLDTNIGS